VLNSKRTRQRSQRTTIAFLGSIESVRVTTYMIILDIVEVVRRNVLGNVRGGMVISTAGIVSIRLAALDIAVSAIVPFSDVFCISDQ
jgi:hypothetical protein